MIKTNYLNTLKIEKLSIDLLTFTKQRLIMIKNILFLIT